MCFCFYFLFIFFYFIFIFFFIDLLPCGCTLLAFNVLSRSLFYRCLFFLILSNIVITLLGKRELITSVFFVLWYVCCLSWFVWSLSLGLIGMVFSAIVSLPGHLLYYSRLSLSRTRLSRINAYLEVKILSLF